ncbi:MAG: endo-beta-N-acetylglucosaminidase, partial [Alloprevotella sp.]|nr:endo-beta-N-acetylglucosaminidase [Alloprevotella sp.]
MRTKVSVLSGCLAFVWLGAHAQQLREGDVSWGGGSPEFGSVLQNWTPGAQVTEDDNFFISRVKPKARFRNAATQVRDTLQVTYDKRLAAWLPFNSTNESGFNRNALPDGLFDSEVFSMWSYVTHWGDWTAPLGRVPAALLDVAHKNGVAVSGLASVPYGGISTTWANNFLTMVNQGADKAAKYLRYYGIDGLGYNSEWSETSVSVAEKIIPFHVALVKEMRKTNPLFENLWYGGTTDDGGLNFTDRLGPEFRNTFGDSENVASSLFLNYNWNYSTKVTVSQNLAKTLGRDPLDLYAGFNMQGANPTSWPSLSQIRYSIGLWGAHSANMFFETRHEKGSEPATKQATYLKRTERWFTGGTRNPLNCPPFIESSNYNADNFSFHGMASMMSARSALSWNLSEEPFITYFNLGNGTFFNWNGVQQHDRQWYNIGVQDYLPTWRYWFANTLLAHDPAAVPASGLDADFTWDEAYVGGSTLRIFGSTPEEYLHLFKTQFALQEGDVITFRYKLKAGSGQANLVLTAEGAENTPLNESGFAVLTADQQADVEDWITKEFTVGGELAGKTLALVALHFQNTNALDLVLGEFSIVRGTSPAPATPVITSATVLGSHSKGVDAKLIFDMPNTKAPGEPCYNLDVNTAFFKLYAQQEGKEPVFMGITTSWAGLIFSAPVDFANGTANQVRFGVSAVALDHKSESEIAWSNYLPSGTYTFSDDIQVSKSVITQGESFVLSYVDPNHEAGVWRLLDEGGNVVFEGMGTSVTVDGLSELGSYTLQVIGVTHSGGSTSSGTREYSKYVSVTDAKFGRLPEIYTLTANEKEADIEVATGETVNLAYTGRHADGGSSQGVQMAEKHFGVNAGQVGLAGNKAYSVAFWMKINNVNGYTQFLAIADKTGGWPLTDWGTVWSGFNDKGVV